MDRPGPGARHHRAPVRPDRVPAGPDPAAAPVPGAVRRRLIHRHRRTGLADAQRRRALSGAVRSSRSDLTLVTVGRLAVRVIMLKHGAVRGILATIGVSDMRLIRDIVASDNRMK